MELPISWLKTHLDTTAAVDDIARTLVQLGHEVEAVRSTGFSIDNVVVGRVLERVQHPNADRLGVCQVEVAKGDVRQIVCGAPNARAGITVAVALEGAKLPGDFVIKKAKIRDVESNGMICSQKELNLGTEAQGIWELITDAKSGTPLRDVLPNETVIEVSVTPNRGDALSVYGLARDLAATGIGSLKALNISQPDTSKTTPIAARIDDEGCSFFSGILIEGISHNTSPKWLRESLESIGLRPINAIADITNFVLHDLGQPLHAYDADKLKGTIRAATAKGGETFDGLDGKTHTLNSGELVIADDSGVLGLAGIVGGVASSVTETTTRVYLEAAQFNRSRIALTGQAHQIHTDARHRFERGIDPAMTFAAAARAAQLIVDTCGGKIVAVEKVGNDTVSPTTIDFDPALVRSFGGLDLPSTAVLDSLKKLGYGVGKSITVPSWATSVTTPEDLVEEVLRLNGLDNVPAVLPPLNLNRIRDAAPRRNIERLARRHMATSGYLETLTYSFINQREAEVFGGGDESLQLLNPIDAEHMRTLRPSLLPGLLRAARENLARSEEHVMLAEVGTVFAPTGEGMHAAALRVGPNHSRHWQVRPTDANIFEMKALAQSLITAYGHAETTIQVRAEGPAFMHPTRSGSLFVQGRTVGYFGELHPLTLRDLNWKGGRVAVMFIDLDLLRATKPKFDAYVSSAFQPVRRDFAFVVDNDTTAGELIFTVRKAGAALVRDVQLFDMYNGDKLPEGKKSLALSVTLQAPDRTLTEAEIISVSDKIVVAAADKFKAELRT